MTTDGAANIKKAVRDLFGEEKWIWCLAHSLDLAAKSAVATASVKALLKEVKRTERYFKHSAPATRALVKAQKEANIRVPLKLIQSVSTRWNTYYTQLVRFIALLPYINKVLVLPQLKKSPPVMSMEQQRLMKKVVHVLRPFARATSEISGHLLVHGSKAIPIVAIIKGQLDAEPKIITVTSQSSEIHNVDSDSDEETLHFNTDEEFSSDEEEMDSSDAGTVVEFDFQKKTADVMRKRFNGNFLLIDLRQNIDQSFIFQRILRTSCCRVPLFWTHDLNGLFSQSHSWEMRWIVSGES